MRHRTLDPANRLVWRHSPRRLDAEEIRDALLASVGALDCKRPAGSPAMALKMIEMADNSPQARQMHVRADSSTSRSVYLPLLRGVTPHALEAFDPVDQTLVTGRRAPTTVPGQELYLLNSSFVRRQSLTLAERLFGQQAADAARIRQAYRLILGRAPSRREVERVQTFLVEYRSEYAREAATHRAGKRPTEDAVRPPHARSAAWLAFVQALFGSAEFRYLK